MPNSLPVGTPVIIVLIPLILGLLDVLLYWMGGNESTISWVMLSVRNKYPLAALSTAYTLGVFLGHLYFPKFVDQGPPVHEVLARMMVGLSPTFYALIITSAGNGVNAAHTRALESGGQMVFAAWMLLAVVGGGTVGAFVLSQHVAPLKGE